MRYVCKCFCICICMYIYAYSIHTYIRVCINELQSFMVVAS